MARYANTSLDRGMAILEALASSAGPQTLTEVSDAVGLARSTTFRLLAVLKGLGFVHKNPDNGLYSLGFKAYRLGQTSRVVELLVREAQPFIQSLAHETGLTSYIASMEGPQVLICDFVEPPGGLKLPFEVGMRLDAHANAAGKALFAAHREDEIAPYFRTHAPRRYTRHTHSSYDALRRDLRETTVKGYAVERGEMRADLEAVAITVASTLDRTILAIATVGKIEADGSPAFLRRVEHMRRAVNNLYKFRMMED